MAVCRRPIAECAETAMRQISSYGNIMTPELNREYAQPGEDDLFEQMVKITLDQMHTEDGHRLRVQHAKATGCVMAFFASRAVRLTPLHGSPIRRGPLSRMAQELRAGWPSNCSMSLEIGQFRMIATGPKIS